MSSRTAYSLKNMKYAVVGQAAGLLISFFARAIFVRILSAEYLGINGLFTNILSLLSLAELGIGASIVYSLYKPLSENDTPKIMVLMKLYKQAYTTIGVIIAVGGVSLTPFLQYFVADMPDIPFIRLIYVLFVINSASAYFFSYKRSLIIADQKRYIATFYRYLFYFLLNVVQIIFLLLTNNYLVFIVLQVINTILENLFVSRKAEKLYPYLKEKTKEKLDTQERKTIIKNVKAMMLHNIGGIVVNGTDSLLLSKIVGVVVVGLYSNYLLITNALQTVFALFFNSIIASVGNLGATSGKERIESRFYQVNFFGFWLFGFSSICLFVLLNPFIALWLGENYLLSKEVVCIITLNFYLYGMRQSNLTFRNALGLFWYDRYKPVFEASINLVMSIFLGLKFGTIGIFIGTAISTLTTCFWIEPLVLFKYGIMKTVKPYFLKYGMYTLVGLVTLVITNICINLVSFSGIAEFLLLVLICVLVPNTVFLLVFHKTKEFQELWKILYGRLLHRIIKNRVD